MPSISSSRAWSVLADHRRQIEHVHMRDLFARDPQRFQRFSLRFGDMLVDFSKNRITEDTLSLLVALAREADLEGWRERMFSGDKINKTEDRAVLHVALRNTADRPIFVDGEDVMPEVMRVREQMRVFSEAVRGGA